MFSEKVKSTLSRYENTFNDNNRKRLFHAVCQEVLNDEYDTTKVLQDVPYGALIGIGNSNLDKILKNFKVLRLHAAYHDAFGYCKSQYDKGPGYSYIIPFPINSCFVGHVTGILYWIYAMLLARRLFNKLDV